MQDLQLVKIKWLDISGHSEWSSIDEALHWAEKETGYCTTVGWILERNRQYLVVASTKADDDTVNDINKIPIKNILDITKLK